MPTLSMITFDDGYYQGTFTLVNRWYTDHLVMAMAAPPSTCLLRIRPDDEMVVDLRAMIDTDAARIAIDALLLGTGVDRTSPIRTDPIAWRDVASFGDCRNHLAVRVGFRFLIGAAWSGLSADGGIVGYYLVFALDVSGRLRAWVNGWSFDLDSEAWRSSSIDSALAAAVPQGVDIVQALVDQGLMCVDGVAFEEIHILPGNGTRQPGEHRGDADSEAALLLIPRRK